MDLFSMRDFDGHERVVFGHDEVTGLRAIIAIHSTALGPAAGGCRMWPFATTAEAVTDVLRLSRGMSFKNALAGLPFGGGKAVIIAEPRQAKTAELFQAYGELVQSLGGTYITAEDVGTTTADMEQVSRATQFVSGLGRKPGEAGGDPAPKTALGVFLGLEAAVKFRMGVRTWKGCGSPYRVLVAWATICVDCWRLREWNCGWRTFERHLPCALLKSSGRVWCL